MQSVLISEGGISLTGITYRTLDYFLFSAQGTWAWVEKELISDQGVRAFLRSRLSTRIG